MWFPSHVTKNNSWQVDIPLKSMNNQSFKCKWFFNQSKEFDWSAEKLTLENIIALTYEQAFLEMNT